jgi:branched-chain amino acid transport system substrate-binding protein
MKKLFMILISTLMVLSLTACAGDEVASSNDDTTPVTEMAPLKIAVVGPLTGDYAEYGTGFKNAVELHAKLINDAGGVLGQPIEIVAFDDKNSGEEAANIAQKIASSGDYSGVVGHFASGVSMAASPTYQEEGIVEISPSASHPDYSSAGDYIFRNNSLISVEGDETLKIADEYLGAKKVAILSVKTDWGTSTADILINQLAAEHPGIEIVAHEEVLDGLTDFSATITKLRESEPDTIITCAMYATVGPFVNQYKDIDPEINIVGFSNAYSEQLVKLAGEDADGICLPVIFFHLSENENVRTFVDTYMETYDNMIPNSLTAQAYDSLGLFAAAAEMAGSTESSAIKDALYEIEYDGVAGLTKFDSNGDAIKSFYWLTIEDGEFVLVK